MQSEIYQAARLSPETELVGRYTIQRRIGSGGMAIVYLAYDRQQPGAPVAVKVLRDRFLSQNTLVERFIREGTVLVQLSHPNIVRIIDAQHAHGLLFYVMEYVPYQSLAEQLLKGNFERSSTAILIAEVCKGLAVIHENNIVHRDLKPANILFAPYGRVKIADFGLAHIDASRLTRENQAVGSLPYIPPESWQGEPPSPAGDFYSLGVTLYEVAVGGLPFEEIWPGDFMRSHLAGDFKPPKERAPQTPAWLNDLIMRLLSKNPVNRPQNAWEIVDFLHQSGALREHDPPR